MIMTNAIEYILASYWTYVRNKFVVSIDVSFLLEHLCIGTSTSSSESSSSKGHSWLSHAVNAVGSQGYRLISDPVFMIPV